MHHSRIASHTIIASVLLACASPHTSSTDARAARARVGPNTDATDRDDARSSAPAATGQWGGDVSFLVGGRSLDTDYWEPVDDQLMFGIETDYRPPDFPLGFEFGSSLSLDYDDDVGGLGIDASSLIAELYFGPRVTFDIADGAVRPYVAGGVTFLWAEFEALGISDSDSSAAGYVHGGVLFALSSSFDLGVDVRSDFGSDITLFGADGDADYLQVALVLGAQW